MCQTIYKCIYVCICNILRDNARNNNHPLVSTWHVGGETMMKSCCQNTLGGWCSEEIPQQFFKEMESGKKWNFVKPCRRRKIPEVNHSRNQDTEPPSLSLQRKPSELLWASPTNHETIHTGIIHHGHSNQAQKEVFTSYAKAVRMGCPAFSKSLLHKKRQ